MRQMHKFIIGQKVSRITDNPWIGEYPQPGIIIGYDNVYLNGIPTYIFKATTGEVFKEVSERELDGEDGFYR